jgi:hypothetical protein
MSLVFEYEKDLSTGQQPYICHEPDSTIYNYYINNNRALDTHVKNTYGIYSDIVFADEERHLTTKAVDRIGIKNFPGIGGIGFYRDLYSDESHAVVPIHVSVQRLNAPVLKSVTIENDMLHIVIMPPDNITYNVYRIIVRQGAFAFEYIIYKTDYYVDKPPVKGDYTVYCIGYDEKMGTVSEESNILTLTVENGSPDWKPDSIDTADIENRLTKIEEEIQNYPNEEISEGVSNILGGENIEIN